MVESFKSFTEEVSKEMKKVSWPTSEQLKESTVVVVVTCAIITTFVFVVDRAMQYAVSLIK
jgi:preprotein translocase subunit SecE